jgi:hypothetical protein
MAIPLRGLNYKDWFRIGSAIHRETAGSDHGRELFHQFSRQAPTLYDAERLDDVWRSIGSRCRGEGAKVVTMGTLVHYKARASDEGVGPPADPPQNPLAAAEAFLCRFPERFVVTLCKDLGVWWEFRGHRWVNVDRAEVLSVVRGFLVSVYKGAIQWFDARLHPDGSDNNPCKVKDQDLLAKRRALWVQARAATLQRDQFWSALMGKNFLLAMCYRPAFYRKLDRNLNLWGCENGVLELSSGVFRDGRPEDYVSKSCGLSWDPALTRESPCAVAADAVLRAVLPDDAERRCFLRIRGAAMSGDAARVLGILLGPGNNGKSKLLELVRRAFGEYGITFTSSVLTMRIKDRDAPSPELAGFKGARLAVTCEVEGRLNESATKWLTSGCDEVTGRFLHCNPIRFVNVAHIDLSTNDMPKFNKGSQALVNRLRPQRPPNTFFPSRESVINGERYTEGKQQHMLGDQRLDDDPCYVREVVLPGMLWLLYEAHKEARRLNFEVPVPSTMRSLLGTITDDQDRLGMDDLIGRWFERDEEDAAKRQDASGRSRRWLVQVKDLATVLSSERRFDGVDVGNHRTVLQQYFDTHGGCEFVACHHIITENNTQTTLRRVFLGWRMRREADRLQFDNQLEVARGNPPILRSDDGRGARRSMLW